MKVRIVCYEEVCGWILGKFAKKLNEELNALSVDSEIGKEPNLKADINHHIIYGQYDGKRTTRDTIMITHIDTLGKLEMLRRQLKAAEMGICMSLATVNQLAAAGLPHDKTCYVLPAHDGVLKPRQTVVGLTSSLYDDGRKNEDMLVELSERIDPKDFIFRIMGAGWHSIVDSMRRRGVIVEYYDTFDYSVYVQLMTNLDYYLYLGNDEGSMGFIDALSAGIPTIVTPQGYHLEVPDGINYYFENLADLVRIFTSIADVKRRRADSVADWTWRQYAVKHIDIWQFLLHHRDSTLLNRTYAYTDGIVSLASSCNTRKPVRSGTTILRLIQGSLKTRYYHARGRFLK